MDMTNQQNSGNKTTLWIAGGCLVVLVCILGAIVFSFGGLYWLGSQTPENTTVQFDIPAEARVGDPFEFSITVTNTGTENIQLVGIDFSMNYLDGIIIDRTDPPYTETSQYDALGGGETFLTYYFRKSIAAGDSLTVIFTAKAVSAGNYGGVVDVCINSDFNCVSNTARTFIK